MPSEGILPPLGSWTREATLRSNNSRRLAFVSQITKLPRMKLIWATLIHTLIFVVIGGGILLLVAGKPALLIGGILVYALVFAKVGCAAH